MKTTLLSLILAIYCISATAQKYDPNWDIKIRENSYYGIALSQAPLLDMAISDAKELGAISSSDSVQFIHEMNGYWYVFTDKGAEGYVKDLRYRPIDLDSIRMAPILAERALLAAKEKAARDSVLAAERIAKAYALYDSVTAQRLLDKNLWVGMTKEMALISIGEPALICYPEAHAPCHETWDYPETALQFKDGQLNEFIAKAEPETSPVPSLEPNLATEPETIPSAPDEQSQPDLQELEPEPEAIPSTMPLHNANPTGSLTNPGAQQTTRTIASQ